MLKVLRKVNRAKAEGMLMPGVSNTLSLMKSWSNRKMQLGAVSGLVVEVTNLIPSPGAGLVATHPAGSAGAVTPSKFSMKIVLHGVTEGEAVGVGVGTGPAWATRESKRTNDASKPRRSIWDGRRIFIGGTLLLHRCVSSGGTESTLLLL
jgi:hypothetical protein